MFSVERQSDLHDFGSCEVWSNAVGVRTAVLSEQTYDILKLTVEQASGSIPLV
jgi:hypothetical protein